MLFYSSKFIFPDDITFYRSIYSKNFLNFFLFPHWILIINPANFYFLYLKVYFNFLIRLFLKYYPFDLFSILQSSLKVLNSHYLVIFKLLFLSFLIILHFFLISPSFFLFIIILFIYIFLEYSHKFMNCQNDKISLNIIIGF